jgi:hypothetical protein
MRAGWPIPPHELGALNTSITNFKHIPVSFSVVPSIYFSTKFISLDFRKEITSKLCHIHIVEQVDPQDGKEPLDHTLKQTSFELIVEQTDVKQQTTFKVRYCSA